jgi:hypothetical protein
MTKLISHNATIPTKKSQVFCTGHENATIGFSPILYAFVFLFACKCFCTLFGLLFVSRRK